MSKLDEEAALQLLANKVSSLLPAGMVVSLMIENGAAWVELVDNCWRPIPLPDHADRSLLEQLNDAVCTARSWATREGIVRPFADYRAAIEEATKK